MREIKFRAFPKFEKYDDEEDFKEYAEMVYSEEADLKRGFGFVFHEDAGGPNEEWEIMQYTGLKDKNGKEIYEGDIIYYDQGMSDGHTDSIGGYHPPSRIDGYRTVVWKEKGFDWGENKSGLSFCTGGQDKFEIIGNIYENPELLTKTK